MGAAGVAADVAGAFTSKPGFQSKVALRVNQRLCQEQELRCVGQWNCWHSRLQ